jgi:hypothetical protein
VTTWVKTRFSPKESWKNKPFSKEDSRFFFRGVEELSELFTEERSRGIPAYFNHPKYRSAYFLYFFPLQAAKFVTVFQLHAKAFEAALEHGRKQGQLRIADLGAGPGTASVAALLQLLQIATSTGEELPPIRLLWIDTNTSIMHEGKKLVEELVSHFTRLRGKVEIEIREAPWWKASQFISEPTSLMLLGHVLNESAGPDRPIRSRSQAETNATELERDEENFELPEPGEDRWGHHWQRIFDLAAGGGTLIVEPASKRNSQFLSQLRDEFLERGLIEKSPSSFWGPCPQAEHCPLAHGRDWCHFSVQARVPGNWFLEFSKGLGSERQWLKFSYLWIASQHEGEKRPAPMPENLRLVISDVLSSREGGDKNAASILLCEPEIPGRLSVPRGSEIKRGDVLKLR